MMSFGVFVKNQHKNWQRSVDGRVPKHEKPIVDRDGHEVEHNHKDSLNSRDD